MKRVIVLILLAISLWGQVQWVGEPASLKYSLPNPSFVHIKQIGIKDIIKIKKIEDTIGYKIIGKSEAVNLNFMKIANQIEIEGEQIIRLGITSKGSSFLGIRFDNFYLPRGCKLFVYTPDKEVIRGAFDYRNNKNSGKFSVFPLPGDSIILELNILPSCYERPIIRIGSIYQIFSSIDNKTSNLSCMRDVFCEPYLEETRGVVAIFIENNAGLIGLCSGCLINQDVAGDALKPYILTARHCTKNSDTNTFLFAFHYQKNDCNGVINYSPIYSADYTISGSKELEYTSVTFSTDLSLLELDISRIPADFNVHYSGWDRRKLSKISKQVTTLHHPDVEEKKISKGKIKNIFPNKWGVKWNSIGNTTSVTAPGSSGSPLFSNHRIIGALSGGLSSCDKTNKKDYYGKLRKKWNKKWEPYLSPNTSSTFIDGRDPCYSQVVIEDRILRPANRYQPKNKVVIQASDKLETKGSVIVQSGAEYKFTANNRIILKPGFRAVKGSKFIARIEPCDVPIAEKLTNNLNDTSAFQKDKTLMPQKDKVIISNITVYPVPAYDKINITIDEHIRDDVLILLYNGMGQVIYRKVFPGNYRDFSLPMKELPQGIYFLQIIYNDQAKVTKILKM